MGIVINQPVGMNLKEMIERSDIEVSVDEDKAEQIILSGGPVSQDRGFIIHSTQDGWSSSIVLTSDVMVTTSKDILSVIGTEHSPQKTLIALGYAGWSAGQLEEELQKNAWLTVEADTDILFDTPIHRKWEVAVHKLGIDIWQLGPDIGHA
jgi:putative transcriptional regulator